MINRLTVSNYRSLGENVVITFGRLTALVGPNGSGKSNVVDALRFLADAMRMGLSGAITHRYGIQAVRRWSGGHPHNLLLRVDLTLPSGPASYALELTGDSQQEYKIKYEDAMVSTPDGAVRFRVENATWRGPEGLAPRVDGQTLALPLIGGDARFAGLLSELQSISVYAIFPDRLREPQKYSPTKPLDQHGANWASILKDQAAETWKPDLVAALLKLTGDVEDIRITSAASYLVARFQHHAPSKKNPKWFDAAQQSDGTLRVAGILTALLQQPAVPVIGIEEPELTVHPGAMPLIFDFLQQASRESQVIITTHSPELLERLEPEMVRVVARTAGITRVSPMNEDQRTRVKDGLMTLGELLRIEGVQPSLDFGA
jgi:predicted ATPase